MTVPYAPQPLQPDPPGQLSNKRGGNTTSDALPQKWRYSNLRGSADPAGQVQLVATRLTTEAAGSSASPKTAWRSGWLGAPTTTALPKGLRHGGCAEIAGRVYYCGGADSSGNISSAVYSASLLGGSVGTWREERPMQVIWPAGSSNYGDSPRYGMGCTTATFGNTVSSGQQGVGGTRWLIIYGGVTPNGVSPTMIAATIDPATGVLGPWLTILQGTGALAYCQLLAVPNQYVTNSLVLSGGYGASSNPNAANWATPIRNAPANSSNWDIPQGFWWANLAGFSGGYHSHFLAYDWPNGRLLAIKGVLSGASQNGMWSSVYGVDYSTWTPSPVGSTWAAITASGVAAAQNDAGGLYMQPPRPGNIGSPNPQSFIYIFGGSNSTAVPPALSGAVNTVQVGTVTWNSANDPSGVSWAISAHPIGNGGSLTGVRVVAGTRDNPTLENFGWGPLLDPNVGRITTLGGGTSAGAAVTAVQSNTISVFSFGGQASGGDLGGSWVSGIGAGLASSDLGTGGSIATSTDVTAPAGSQDVIVNYGAVTTAAISGLSDGDLLQHAAQFTDKLGGDPSPYRTTVERIGQPPSISNVTVAAASGQPIVAWAFNSGLGGGKQATWRLQVVRHLDSTLMFDSGLRYGQANTTQVQCAPMLATATQYDYTITATSDDSPVSGSSATATATGSFTQTLSSVPATPTGFSVSADSTNKWLLLGATAAANTTAIRVYYRLTGSGLAYRLYAEVAQAGAGAFSYKLMDKIALGQAYDVQVSAVGGSAANESTPTTAQSVTIQPDADSPSGWLHLAGQPLTGALGIGVKGQAWPKLTATRDSKVLTRFNSRRSLVRQGILDYRTLDLEILSVYSASVGSLETLVDALLAGGTAWWRDRNGLTLPVALDSPEEVNTLYPNHRDFTLKLVQVDDVFSPYLSNGLAIGIPTLDGGSIPPLSDTVEQVA